MTRVARAVALGFALGCAAPIWTQVSDLQQAPIVRKVEMLEFSSDPAPGVTIEPDAAAIVATRVLEALTQETDLEVFPPDGLPRAHSADAVLSGVVRRYVERSGGPAGSNRPSAVWFELELRTVEGALLWSGTYDETQAALSENLGSLGRAWERGFRWVTAADLAGYGARQLARALAAETAPWS